MKASRVGKDETLAMPPCAWGHTLLLGTRAGAGGAGAFRGLASATGLLASRAVFDVGNGKCLYVQREEMSLLMLTWRESHVLAPVLVPLQEDGAGMDFKGRRAVGRERDAT